MEADDLQAIMQEFGEIEDIVIIRDKLTSTHRGRDLNVTRLHALNVFLGCAFVTFTTNEAADAAVAKLHNKVTLPPVGCCKNSPFLLTLHIF